MRTAHLCGAGTGTLDYDQRLLASEIMRLALREQLFTFVMAKPAAQPNGQSVPLDGTNNEAERANGPPPRRVPRGELARRLLGHGERVLSQASWNRCVCICPNTR